MGNLDNQKTTYLVMEVLLIKKGDTLICKRASHKCVAPKMKESILESSQGSIVPNRVKDDLSKGPRKP
jgi:hypothetical protein